MYPVNYDPFGFVTESGDRYKTKYIGEVQDNKKILLVSSGKIDLWELHSAQAESCDVNKIVERFQNGDLTALNRVQGSYLDITGAPSSLRETYESMNRLRLIFDGLPSDVAAAFGSFENWLDLAGSDFWTEKMSSIGKEESEVVNNEQE